MRILAGSLKGRIIPVKGKEIRPATAFMKKRIFDIISDLITDSYIIDLFAGTGSLGFEALSRGAKHIDFIEKDFKRYEVLRNISIKWGIEDNVSIYYSNAMKWLERNQKYSDILFVDPPYKFKDTKILSEKIKKFVKINTLIIWHCSDNLPYLNLFNSVKYLKKGSSKVYFLKPGE